MRQTNPDGIERIRRALAAVAPDEAMPLLRTDRLRPRPTRLAGCDSAKTREHRALGASTTSSLVVQHSDIVALRSVATRFRGSVRSSATSSSTNTLILFPLRSVATRSKGKRRHSLSRADVATFNTDVVMRAERFVYYSGPSFVFKQDGVVVDGGAMEWLRRTGDDTRGGKKRGVVNVAKSTWRRPPRRP